jgi:hypothetical protein
MDKKGMLSFLSTFMGSGFNDALLYVNGSFPFILLGKWSYMFCQRRSIVYAMGSVQWFFFSIVLFYLVQYDRKLY